MAWNNKRESVKTLLKEISANTFEVDAWLWVDVFHINDPHSFYIRPWSYRKYLPLLQTRGNRPKAAELKIGEYFIFKSEAVKCNLRGKIVQCDKYGDTQCYKMFAIDIGSTEDDVPLNRIWKTSYSLHVPPLATHCQLADCMPRNETWDSDSIDAMRSYVVGERAKIIVKGKTEDKLVVELYNSRPDDIATLMVLTKYAKFNFAHNTTGRLKNPEEYTHYYTKRDMQVDEVIHVRMLSGILLEQFSVIPVDEYQLYLNDRDYYTSCARFESDLYLEELKLNDPIGVWYHKSYKYERGFIKELLPQFNRAKVHMVDLGTVIEESVLKMKPVPIWYLRIPPRALCCSLHSSQSLSNDVATRIHPGSEFKITIKKIGDDYKSCPNVVTIFPVKF